LTPGGAVLRGTQRLPSHRSTIPVSRAESAERRTRLTFAETRAVASLPFWSLTAKRYTLLARTPSVGWPGTGTGWMETLSDVAPWATTKAPGVASSWACGSDSVVATATRSFCPPLTAVVAVAPCAPPS